jgi:hypothetical protein
MRPANCRAAAVYRGRALRVSLVVLLIALPTPSAWGDHYVLGGVVCPLRRVPSRIAVKFRDGRTDLLEPVPGARLARRLGSRGDVLVLESTEPGAELDTAALEGVPGVDFSSRVYLGEDGREAVVPPEVVVKLRAGTAAREKRGLLIAIRAG